MTKRIDFTSYKTILIAALIIRIIAAFFSQGYGMHDDHFLIVEASASWVDGFDYNHWLPWSVGNAGHPEGHSFTYVGLNYLFFSLFKFLGIVDPKIMMLFNRLIHALFSILIVHFGMKITEQISSKALAVKVGWLLALLWVLPFLSVRNLVEVTCIPFVMWSMWILLSRVAKKYFLYAGLIIGVAISFRYQVGVFAVGVAAVLLFKKGFMQSLWYCLGVLFMFGLTQGVVDYLIWGYPFAEFIGYATYNMNEGTAYIPNNNYAMYFIVLMGIFLVPLGILLGFGFFKSYKNYLLLFIPVLVFILFHTFYPSKQERFILPVFPLFAILGVVGIQDLLSAVKWQKFWDVSWKIFWVLNIPLLLFATFTYTKKSRVEAMYFFYDKDMEGKRILQETTGDTGTSLLPKFYAGDWELSAVARENEEQPLSVHENYSYAYILFCGEENLSERVADYQSIYPEMKLVKVCDPSFVDLFLRWLNDRNSNEYIEIWQTNVH